MARRFSAPYQSEPVSSLASWARNLAVFAVVAVVVSIIIVRFGFLEMKPALATFLGGLAIAALSILFGLAGFAAIWQNGSRGMARILLAFLIDGAILAYPAYLGLQYRKLPAIHDITTDPIDPPRFEALARLRTGDGANPAVYAGLYSAEQQRQFYPDIEPIELEISVDRAYAIALQLVNKRKWLVIDERAPQPPRRIGRIEAVARSPIMGFREDISIRVVPDGDDSRVDIRSASRFFESDLGSNASRVTKFIDDLNTAADADALKPDGSRARCFASPRNDEKLGARHPVGPTNHGITIRRHDPAGDQIFQMRQHGVARSRREPGIDADIDRAHHGRDISFTLGEAMQDRGLARLAMADQEAHEARTIRNLGAVAGEIQILLARGEPVERLHVVDHRAVGRRHDRGRPPHHVIADEVELSLGPGERKMVGGVAGRGDGFQTPAGALDDVAMGDPDVRREVAIGAGFGIVLLALEARAQARCGP